MGTSMLRPQDLLHDAASPAQRDALLGMLGATPPDLDGACAAFLDDPVLLHALLHAIPLGGEPLTGPGLAAAVRARVEALGPDLLTAWLLARPAPPDGSRTDIALRLQSRYAAQLARALAAECGLDGRADDAALAAMWSRLAQLLRLGATHGTTLPARVLNAKLAEACGVAPEVADALVLADGAEEEVATAHPLCAVVWGANRLAANPEQWAEACARVCRVPSESLARVTAACPAPSLPAQAEGADPALPAPLAATPPRLVEAALAGFAHRGFAGLDADALRRRYEAATRLLCDQSPLLVVLAAGQKLEALPLAGPARVAALFDESACALDDDASVLALALRSQTPTSWHGEELPGRSVRDWQLARWLRRGGFVCIPFRAAGAPGALVMAPERSPLPATDLTRMLVALTEAAACAAMAGREHARLQAELRAEIEQRHHEHARRIAHEARNPLSVIRNYLHLIPQRYDERGLDEDMRLLGDELDRLGRLIDAVAQPPQDAPEAPRCDVGALLRDMRAMVGETLFAPRGIHLDIRMPSEIPLLAMPASALRQVLLNLLHNAADILHPGGRCSVIVAGELIADGARCLELRVIDNGPGLPPERLHRLFEPQPSTKGGQHQGVGLAISRELLERHGARILCRSQNGVGTSFQLLMPTVCD